MGLSFGIHNIYSTRIRYVPQVLCSQFALALSINEVMDHPKIFECRSREVLLNSTFTHFSTLVRV